MNENRKVKGESEVIGGLDVETSGLRKGVSLILTVRKEHVQKKMTHPLTHHAHGTLNFRHAI
jgi:hypothetical protein